MYKILPVFVFLVFIPHVVSGADLTPEEITKKWKKGETLPESVFATYELPTNETPKEIDTGINILVDLNRKCNFGWLWI